MRICLLHGGRYMAVRMRLLKMMCRTVGYLLRFRVGRLEWLRFLLRNFKTAVWKWIFNVSREKVKGLGLRFGEQDWRIGFIWGRWMRLEHGLPNFGNRERTLTHIRADMPE